MAEEQAERRELEPGQAAGRLAGRLVNGLGLRLLRLQPVREAIRRAAEQASEEPRSPES